MSRRVLHPKGFTLLEVSIGLLLMGIALAVATMSVSAVTSAELKKTTGMIQGLMRDTYTRAALSGNSHRVVFDMEAKTYWVEATEGGVVMPREKLELTREGLAFLDPVDERLDGIEADTDDAEERAKIELYRPQSWAPVPFPGDDRLDEVRPAKLPTDIWFKSIWVDHMSEPANGGQVAVHCYPGGYTQEAHITITDEEEGQNTLTLVTNPLTGEVYVETEPPEIPREY